MAAKNDVCSVGLLLKAGRRVYLWIISRWYWPNECLLILMLMSVVNEACVFQTNAEQQLKIQELQDKLSKVLYILWSTITAERFCFIHLTGWMNVICSQIRSCWEMFLIRVKLNKKHTSLITYQIYFIWMNLISFYIYLLCIYVFLLNVALQINKLYFYIC